MRLNPPLILLLTSLLAGCGGSRAQEPDVVVKPPEMSATAPAVVESVHQPLTQLERSDVSETVEAGLGRFLQEVELEESLDEGKFEGFRIVRFRDPKQWVGVGLHVGDIIVSINDSPIERPEQAYAVFVSLKSADALEVSYLRDGQAMRLSLPIVGDAPASSESASSSPKSTGKKPAPSKKPEQAADAKP